MKDILNKLDLFRYNCDFVDVRIEDNISTSIDFKNSELIDAYTIPKCGAFIRIKLDGRWFYSSITDLSKIEESIENQIRLLGLDV